MTEPEINYRPAGVEGLVVKGAGTPYVPGQRKAWVKVKSRETIELIVGAVIGPITAPESIVAGLYPNTELVIAGRSVPLSPTRSRSLSAVLRPAASDHPWPETVLANRFSGRDRIKLTKVDHVVIGMPQVVRGDRFAGQHQFETFSVDVRVVMGQCHQARGQLVDDPPHHLIRRSRQPLRRGHRTDRSVHLRDPRWRPAQRQPLHEIPQLRRHPVTTSV